MDWTNLSDWAAFGSIITPIMLAAFAIIGWGIRTKLERRMALEDKLREDRIEIYNKILKPFILILTPDAAWQSNPKNRGKDKNTIAIQEMLSLEYREQGFRLTLFASDEVVKAYNNLMQYFFQRSKQKADKQNESLSKDEVKDMMTLLGTFLLEIRKNTGNESTELKHWDMLEWFLTDAREYRNN